MGALGNMAPRGGVVENISGKDRALVLTGGGIERFEDNHRGIFDVWDGFFGRGSKPTSREVRAIIALALVGGGMPEGEADKLDDGFGPADLLHLYEVAQGVVGAAFIPDVTDDVGEDDAPEKPNGADGSMSEPSSPLPPRSDTALQTSAP